jgi:hypothetical protein
MTWARHASPRVDDGPFARARAEAVRKENIQKARAVHTVAGHSLDAEDCRHLLSMLGLDSLRTES